MAAFIEIQNRIIQNKKYIKNVLYIKISTLVNELHDKPMFFKRQ